MRARQPQISNCQLMICNRLDLTAKRMAGRIKRFALQGNHKTAANLADRGVAPDETIDREQTDQRREHVVHEVSVAVARDRQPTLLNRCDGVLLD